MSDMNKYCTELKKAVEMLAQHEKTIFLGQTVAYPGSRFTYKLFVDIPLEKRIEVPIIEDMQMGISNGLAQKGFIPVSVYPRLDFLLLATNQLVNHLDKMEEMSSGQYNPKVIIKATVGMTNPYPGPQHCKDYTSEFKSMLKNVDVVRLERADDIMPAYRKALESSRSTLLIDVGDLHYANDA